MFYRPMTHREKLLRQKMMHDQKEEAERALRSRKSNSSKSDKKPQVKKEPQNDLIGTIGEMISGMISAGDSSYKTEHVLGRIVDLIRTNLHWITAIGFAIGMLYIIAASVRGDELFSHSSLTLTFLSVAIGGTLLGYIVAVLLLFTSIIFMALADYLGSFLTLMIEHKKITIILAFFITAFIGYQNLGINGV